MVKSGCGNDQVGLREGVVRPCGFLDKEAPLEHHVLGNGKDPLSEHRAYLVVQPGTEVGTANGIADHFNAVSDFSERHRADEQLVQRLGRNEPNNPRRNSSASMTTT